MSGGKKKFNYGIVILVLISIGIFAPNYAQYQVAAFGTSIREQMNLSQSQFSSIATAPLIPGIFLSLISGLLVDKFGARKTLTVSVALTAIACVVRIFSKNYFPMYISMIFIGVCATFLNSNAPKVMGQWFSPAKSAATMGVFMAFANGGIALGTGTASLYGSMNTAFIGSGIIAVGAFVCWLFFMRDKKDDMPILKSAEPQEKVSIKKGIVTVAKAPVVWITAFSLFLCAGAMTSISNFLPSALEGRGLTSGNASLATMGMTIGALVGNLVSPFIFAKLHRPRLTVILYGIVGAVGLAFGWITSTSTAVLFIVLFLTGFACSGLTPMIMSIPVRDEKIGTRYGGTAGGFVATIQLGLSVITPTYIVAPAVGDNYSLMFIIFGLLLVAFMVVAQFLPLGKLLEKR